MYFFSTGRVTRTGFGRLITVDRPESSGGTTCAVLLAAGGGSRFADQSATRTSTQTSTDPSPQSVHKLQALLNGRPVYQWALQAVIESGLDHVVVVTGAVALDLPDSVIEVHNEHWMNGQAGSLQLGVRAATELGADAIVVGLGDQPFVVADAWRAVARASTPIAVATYGGRRANPVRLHRSTWSLLPREGDQGARSLIALRPELVGEVACNGSPADIDTMEDLQQWNSSMNSQ